MAIMATATVQRTKLKSLILLTLALSSLTDAAEFRLTPALKLEGTYTDNIELGQSDKTSSFVNQFGVTLDQDYKSKVLEFEVDLYS